MTITKERLLKIQHWRETYGSDSNVMLLAEEAEELARIALAALTAEPVRYLNKFSGTCVTLEQQPNAADDVAVYMPLYAAPPVPVQVDIEILASALKNAPLAPSDNQGRPRAPVVPPAIEQDYKVIKSILPTANPDEYACCIAADMWNTCRAAMLQGSQPVSQTYKLNELSGNSPVTQDGWISCSERMPEQGAYISAVSKHGEYVAGQVIDDWLDLHDGTSFGLDEVYLWMMLPPLLASPQQ
ncbi:DUF551 domain-containing protein [Salmonella enterica]|nr:DUF551 domain-containing protein [Salmonella enterica]EJO7838376.1 DUF551 domain-containing protein [Salmonella enterica]EKT7114253.1 DUF551 domain-containing protein [Salmonella enterica]